MGKARIISEFGDGQYRIEIQHDTTAAEKIIIQLDTMIAQTNNQIASATNPQVVSFLRLRKTAIEKRKAQVQAVQNNRDVLDAWCVDLTEGLSGEVGTIEIGTETAGGTNIRPGYGENAAYLAQRDGIHTPTLTMYIADFMQNFAVLPAIQKWRPTYRYGTISNIDTEADTCSVRINELESSLDGLNINHAVTLHDVPVDYMSCNASAFEAGDSVVVRWTPYRTTGIATVIGFKDHPKPCESVYFVVVRLHESDVPDINVEKCWIIWDMDKNDYASDPLIAGGSSWPKSWNEIVDFLNVLAEEPVQGEIYNPGSYRGVHSPCMAGNDGSCSEIIPTWEAEGFRTMRSATEALDDPIPICVQYYSAIGGSFSNYAIIEAYARDSENYIRLYSGSWAADGNMPWPNQILRHEWEEESSGEVECSILNGACHIEAVDDTSFSRKWHTPLGTILMDTRWWHREYPFKESSLPPAVDNGRNRKRLWESKRNVRTNYTFIQLYVFVYEWREQYVTNDQQPPYETHIHSSVDGVTVKCLAAFERHEDGVEKHDPADMDNNSAFAEAVRHLFQTRIDDGKFNMEMAQRVYPKVYKKTQQ